MKKKIKRTLTGYITLLDYNNIDRVLEYCDLTDKLNLGRVYKTLEIAKDYFSNPRYAYPIGGVKFKKVKVTLEEI